MRKCVSPVLLFYKYTETVVSVTLEERKGGWVRGR